MKMRKSLSALILGVFVLAPASALAAGGDSTTVTGEVLDLACYVSHEGGSGPEHVSCAVKCVKGGQPMGLLAADGTVYVLFADHGDSAAYEKTKDFAGKKVEISGPVADRGGLKGLTVHSVKAL